MTTNTKKTHGRRKTASPEHPPVVPHLRALFHTVRCIAQHEDALCTVLHNLQNHPESDAELTAELHALIDELPSRDYIDDLDAVVNALAAAGSRTTPPMPGKSAKARART